LGFGRPDSFSHSVVVPEEIWLCHGTDIKPMDELVSHNAMGKISEYARTKGTHSVLFRWSL
jgi:hypothetical protein